jgi:hypothetical protein
MPDREQAKVARQSTLTRRKFIVLSPVAVFAIFTGIVATNPRSTLQAFVDTLLPADEFGPAASATGTVEALEATFSGSWGRWAELKKLTIWLNISSGGIFANADANVRNEVVARLDRLTETSARWKTYNRARRAVMRHYFGNAERALAMGLPGAPQPHGYPDAHLPWKRPERG